MKKLFITLLVLLSVSSFAQNHFIGVQFGMNSSMTFGKELFTNVNLSTSFTTGLTYNYRFKNNFLFGSGLTYERKGYQDDSFLCDYMGNNQDDMGRWFGSSTIEVQYTCIGVPLKAGYQIGKCWTA
ncbi:outer membrane beta-barrel protein [Lentimicrobium sp. L6]|uniref:outer membrane beta-barrel protein n=1 Tax=Lentimicrobium sp. L6 TaxID=2735916 RepID=UPI0015527FC6|nr:outer membrane beta-barrel protein [Lentimicrobium sp. L6]NPD83276.1 outer membrane beta-barrel protein [Lentimicrobium sp. L6]